MLASLFTPARAAAPPQALTARTGPGVRFALYRSLDVDERPVGFQDLAALARSIHRRREGRSIDLQDVSLTFLAELDPVAGVSIWTLDGEGDRTDFLGYAWLDGMGADILRAALQQIEPQPVWDGRLAFPGQRDGRTA